MADVRLTATNPEDSSVVPVACDASGRLLLEERGEGPQGPQGPPGPSGQDGQDGQDGDPFSGNFAGDVTFGGSAEFAGGGFLINSSGIPVSVKSGGADDYAYEVYNTTSQKTTVHIDADGSAEFNGTIDVGNVAGSQGLRITNTGTAYTLGTGANAAFWAGPDFGSEGNAVINYDGSAEFAGKVDTGSSTHGTHALTVANNSALGTILAANHSGRKAIVCRSPDIVGQNTDTISLYADGSAEFAGGKAGFTAEGYLWCTTRRGDTVILDATSQGMGIWEDYSPTSRIDEIRDKLDVNRPDTGEMPADTQ